jgi:hypothetical protein
LRLRLSAPERHGKRDAGAQQTAICHPLPPATNTRATMVVPPPLADLRHHADRWQTVFARMMLLAEKSVQNADRCDIQATVSAQAGEFSPIERVFFATPRN